MKNNIFYPILQYLSLKKLYNVRIRWMEWYEYKCWPSNDVIYSFYSFIESLYGCFDDCGICLFGYCCTPCLFGQNAHQIDNSNCCLMCCGYSLLSSCYLCCILHSSKRGALRQKYGLREEPCGDCPVTCCCGPCALCQEARFLQRRGIINKRPLII